MFSFYMQVFIEEDNVDFGVGEADMVSNGTTNVVSNGTIGVVFDGVVSVVFNGRVGVYVHHGVHDSLVGVASRSTSYDIFTKVPSPSSFFFYGFWKLTKDGQSSSWCWCSFCRHC
jgi:hypothetical protein